MDLRNYLSLKASLSETILQKLRSLEGDPIMDSIQWDLSNIYPRKPLPEVSKKGCAYRARVVVSGPIGDPALGEYVSTAIINPRFMITAISRDTPAADYLLSEIKITLDDVPIVRIDSVDYGGYNTPLNFFHNDLILSLNLGSIPVESGRSGRCQKQEVPAKDCGLDTVVDPERDLTFLEP